MLTKNIATSLLLDYIIVTKMLENAKYALYKKKKC